MSFPNKPSGSNGISSVYIKAGATTVSPLINLSLCLEPQRHEIGQSHKGASDHPVQWFWFSPGNFAKNIDASSLSSFSHHLNLKCRGWAMGTWILKRSLDDTDFQRGLRINPYSWGFWESEDLSLLSKVSQQACGRAGLRPSGGSPELCSYLRDRAIDETWIDGWCFSTGREASSGFQRRKSVTQIPAVASLSFFPSTSRPKSARLFINFPLQLVMGFSHPPSSLAPRGLEILSVEEIIANPWHTSRK